MWPGHLDALTPRTLRLLIARRVEVTKRNLNSDSDACFFLLGCSFANDRMSDTFRPFFLDPLCNAKRADLTRRDSFSLEIRGKVERDPPGRLARRARVNSARHPAIRWAGESVRPSVRPAENDGLFGAAGADGKGEGGVGQWLVTMLEGDGGSS